MKSPIETLNIPEAFSDWDTDHTLDLEGHRKKWRDILKEMVIMVLLQFVTNMLFMVPFLVTGKEQH